MICDVIIVRTLYFLIISMFFISSIIYLWGYTHPTTNFFDRKKNRKFRKTIGVFSYLFLLVIIYSGFDRLYTVIIEYLSFKFINNDFTIIPMIFSLFLTTFISVYMQKYDKLRIRSTSPNIIEYIKTTKKELNENTIDTLENIKYNIESELFDTRNSESQTTFGTDKSNKSMFELKLKLILVEDVLNKMRCKMFNNEVNELKDKMIELLKLNDYDLYDLIDEFIVKFTEGSKESTVKSMNELFDELPSLIINQNSFEELEEIMYDINKIVENHTYYR